MTKNRDGATRRLARKTAKFFRSPRAFFADSPLGRLVRSGANHSRSSTGRTIALAWGFAQWKRELVCRTFPEFEFRFIPLARSESFWGRLLQRNADSVFLVWGYQEPPQLVEYAQRHHVPVYRMEDGFIRSVGLGAAHALPRSLVLDRSGHLYFDAAGPSDLEILCQTYDFTANAELMAEAEACRKILLTTGLSKYNHTIAGALLEFRPGTTRILVVGQVEDDASILRGRASDWTNLRAAQRAREENPNAEIVFKPHPDDLHGHTKHRKPSSSLESIGRYARVLFHDAALTALLPQFDHVYTITSLAGFEAILRGIHVTVLGYPFYAGWGLSDDRQVDARRSRLLTLHELFAAAYLLYPRYFDPATGARRTLSETIAGIEAERQASIASGSLRRETS